MNFKEIKVLSTRVKWEISWKFSSSRVLYIRNRAPCMVVFHGIMRRNSDRHTLTGRTPSNIICFGPMTLMALKHIYIVRRSALHT